MRTIALACASLLLLGACTTLSPYPFRTGDDVALIDVSTVPSPSFCTNGRFYRLDTNAQKLGVVPAGRHIALMSFVYISGYQEHWSCAPAIGFRPMAGKTYYATTEIADQKCRVEIYREGADNRIGLDLEPTVTAGYCPADPPGGSP